MGAADEVWHMLQFSDALDLELACALSEFVPVILWQPVPVLPMLSGAFCETEHIHPGTRLRLRTFPIVRGYARLPLGMLARLGTALAARLSRQTSEPQRSVLICTTPYFASVAEQWQGPVVYWLSDLIAMYRRPAFNKVRKLDERMCRAATLVCPNSVKIAEYLIARAGCPPDRCHILPNATGSASLLQAPLQKAVSLPEPYAGLPRPLAGVIGNLAGNTDWVFLEQVMRRTPWLFWLFVGPASMPISDSRQRRARRWVMRHHRTCFIGPRPYTELYAFARGLDVAVLPYRLREPTHSGSSTRFYDHLAAGHPILATTAVFSLRDQTPLVTLADDPAEAATVLERWRASGFQDGLRQARWQASLQHTWRDRARTLLETLQSSRAEKHG